MASLFGLSNLIYHPKLPVFQNSLHTRSLHPYYRPLKRRITQYKSLTISSALTESNSPDSSVDQDIQPLLQDISESLVLPPDYFAQLPDDLRLDFRELFFGEPALKLNDAAFDISCGPVIDECGQEMGEALLNLSRAWEVADTSTSNDIAHKLPALASLLKGNAKSAFGKRLISSGRRFQSMGQYGQGELLRIAKAMIKAGQLLSASAVTSASDEEPKTERMLKFGNLQVELTATKANIGAAIAFVFGIICWQLSQGIQSTPESSLQYANNNALLLGKSLRGALLALCYSSTILSGFSTIGLILLARQLKSAKK
ncbi:uncharacterized protein LOC113349845 isoform X1 [Papaver somniferum]|uniref:uncharacterized protein LOC113349845 isoform X1 n=1 Tax=Papaver somniferum TaxID=3469 RepID=UPI000E700084|nr:uncharacterized protein LOC113349845 isoform X1 [Papaver somniferum]